MSCETYREKLQDELLRGDTTLRSEVAAHVRGCADCREFYEAQRWLLGAMDSGVRALVNESVPASLVAGVKARIEAKEVRQSLLSWRISAVAVVGVLALIVTPLFRSKLRVRNVSLAAVAEMHLERGVSTSAAAPVLARQPAVTSQSRTAKRRRIHDEQLARTDSPRMEVIIDPAEAEGLHQLATAAALDPQWAIAMTRPGKLLVMGDEKIRPQGFPPQEMRDLDEEATN